MNQRFAFFTRLQFACAVGLCAASIGWSQTPTGSSSNAQRQTPAPDKNASANISPLDEELSKTPAGKTVAKFFAAFNSGDIKIMRGFHESFGGDMENADKDMEFFEETGGLKLHSVTRSNKDQIAVLVQTKKDARWLTFEFTLGAQEPYPVNGINVSPAAPPAQTSH